MGNFELVCGSSIGPYALLQGTECMKETVFTNMTTEFPQEKLQG